MQQAALELETEALQHFGTITKRVVPKHPPSTETVCQDTWLHRFSPFLLIYSNIPLERRLRPTRGSRTSPLLLEDIILHHSTAWYARTIIAYKCANRGHLRGGARFVQRNWKGLKWPHTIMHAAVLGAPEQKFDVKTSNLPSNRVDERICIVPSAMQARTKRTNNLMRYL